MKRFVSAAFVVAAVSSCGDDRAPLVPTDTDTGGSSPLGGRSNGGSGAKSGQASQAGEAGSAGEPSIPGEGGAGGGSSVDPTGPLVTIQSPAEVLDPDEGEVLFETSVTVLCQVAPVTGAGVNQSTVVIEMLSPGGVASEAAGAPTGRTRQYEATFSLTALPSGPVSFRCSASDSAPSPNRGSATVSTFVDHGPVVKGIKPEPGSAHALLGPVAFQFDVQPTPLSDEDEAAQVGEVTLEVNGEVIRALTETDGSYKATVDFNDKTLFPQTPSGSVPVVIKAANQRSPKPVINTTPYSFVIDGEGPVINVTEPRTAVIGEEITLVFTAVDALSQVDPETVRVHLNTDVYPFDLKKGWSRNNDTYAFTFDTAQVHGSASQISLTVRASDEAGNESDGASRLLYLDWQPPIVDLDPPNVREVSFQGAQTYCSNSFDPLGAAAGQGGRVANTALFRVLVWDKTNSSPGQETHYYATTDPSSVTLYLQIDQARPLLIDTNGDGVCDDIETEGAEFQRLAAVPPTGSATSAPDDSDVVPPAPEACEFRTGPPPKRLCEQESSDLTRVIKHNIAGVEPVIYGLPPLEGLECTGRMWEIASLVTKPDSNGDPVPREGWVCLAARASDRVGNEAVSPPLHVCMSDGDGDEPACATLGTEPPSCTDGCTLPVRSASEDWRLYLR